MKKRVAIIGIIVEDTQNISELNEILHENGDWIIGRMGLPYREKQINIISIAIDAPEEIINGMTGKIGRLSGISAKATYSKI